MFAKVWNAYITNQYFCWRARSASKWKVFLCQRRWTIITIFVVVVINWYYQLPAKRKRGHIELILSIAYQERSTSHIPHHSPGPTCRSHTWPISSQFLMKKSHGFAISSRALKNQIKKSSSKAWAQRTRSRQTSGRLSSRSWSSSRGAAERTQEICSNILMIHNM